MNPSNSVLLPIRRTFSETIPFYGSSYRYLDPWSFAAERIITVQAIVIGVTEFIGQPTICSTSNITSVEFQASSPIGGIIDNSPSGSNPGKRIFPDKNDPTDGTDRTKVRVKATVSPALSGTRVYFKTFDLDDPSTDAAPVDSNGSSGGDNRGKVSNHSEGVITASAVTNDTGVATADLTRVSDFLCK